MQAFSFDILFERARVELKHRDFCAEKHHSGTNPSRKLARLMRRADILLDQIRKNRWT